jgi:hypothetical protein
MKMVEQVLTLLTLSHVVALVLPSSYLPVTLLTLSLVVALVLPKYDVGRTSDPTWENGNQTGRHDMISATQLLGHGSCNWGA